MSTQPTSLNPSQLPGYQVNCDPKTGICKATLNVSTRSAYEIPQARRAGWIGDKLKSVGPSAEYLGLGFTVSQKDVNKSKRTVPFVCSTDTVDRYGDVIEQDGWKLDFYKRNPVVLYGHDSHALPIGKALEVGIVNGNLAALLQFADADTYAFADVVFNLIAGGFLSALSVGFIPLSWEWRRGEADDQGYEPIIGRRYPESELLENSVVTVPANPEALVIGRGYESVLVSVGMIEETRKEIEKKNMSCACDKSHSADIRAVVPFHAYPLADADAAWDASKELGSTEKAADWKKMSTIIMGDGEKKGDFKLPHHKGPGGKFATVRRGVANALARCGQVKGASSADKAGAKKHLAKHMAEFHKSDGKAMTDVQETAFIDGLLRNVDLIDAMRDAAPENVRQAITVDLERFILGTDSKALVLADLYSKSKDTNVFKTFEASEQRKFSNEKMNKRLVAAHKSVMCAMDELTTAHSDATEALGNVRDMLKSVIGTEPMSDDADMETESVAARISEAHATANEAKQECMRAVGQRFKSHMQKAIHNLKMLCDYVAPDDDDEETEDDDDEVTPEQEANANADQEAGSNLAAFLNELQTQSATNSDKSASNDLQHPPTGATPASASSKEATSPAETVDKNQAVDQDLNSLVEALGKLQN